MAVTKYIWPVAQPEEAVIPADEVVSPLDRTITVGINAHLGFGLLRPFRRDKKNDFANAGGEALVQSAVGQVLGTHSSSDFTIGEMPWRPEFGSLVYLLRHRLNDDGQVDLARYYVHEALQRWEPRVLLKRASVTTEKSPEGEETVLVIRVVYDIIQENVPGNQVILPDVEQVFRIAA